MYLVYGRSCGLDYIDVYCRSIQKGYYDWSRYDFINFFRDNFIMNDFQISLLSRCSVRDMCATFLIWSGSDYSIASYVFESSAYSLLSDLYRCCFFRKCGGRYYEKKRK